MERTTLPDYPVQSSHSRNASRWEYTSIKTTAPWHTSCIPEPKVHGRFHLDRLPAIRAHILIRRHVVPGDDIAPTQRFIDRPVARSLLVGRLLEHSVDVGRKGGKRLLGSFRGAEAPRAAEAAGAAHAVVEFLHHDDFGHGDLVRLVSCVARPGDRGRAFSTISCATRSPMLMVKSVSDRFARMTPTGPR